MKKVFLFIGVVLAMASCKNEAQKSTSSPSAAGTASIEIAYVNVDSVMSVYEYAKDLTAKFESMGKAKESELQGRAEKFQRRAADLDSKYKQQLITTANAQKLGQELEQERQSLGQLQGKMQQEMQFQEREMLLTLNDSLLSVLRDLNKDGKYKMILRNSVVLGNVLVATPETDITGQVIEMLNARYKKDAK